MKLRRIFTYIIISITAFTVSVSAQTNASNARRAAHSNLLANHSSTIDRTVIQDFLKEDVNRREHNNNFSAEGNVLADNILKEAYKHIGKKYVHGSKGPATFDCSGFTSYVYKQNGMSITSWSKGQYTLGRPIDRNNLRKGDLVFFTSRSSGSQVGHVGIVVSADNATGNFKFIHASITGVKVSDFSGYYVPRYIGARRLINE